MPGAGETDAAVVLGDAAVVFDRRTVWSDVDLEVAAGEFVVILGPNGAGKTTLVRTILGLQRLSSGAVRVFGTTPVRARARIGYAPQRQASDRHLNVRGRDIVALGVDGARWGMAVSPAARRRRRELVDDAVEAVGATAYIDKPIGGLSGGEQQRLLLAQAVVSRPQLLLLDEPLGSLDLRSQAVITSLIADLAHARGITVLLVAHDVNPLMSVLDRVAYVAAGRVAVGTADEIITSAALTALYDHPIEVLHDSRGRVVVVGLDDRESHHHA